MRGKIISYGDVLGVQISNSDDCGKFDHMLKEPDRRHVRDIMYKLLYDDLVPCLTGDAVYNFVFNGRIDYNRIDISALPDYTTRNIDDEGAIAYKSKRSQERMLEDAGKNHEIGYINGFQCGPENSVFRYVKQDGNAVVLEIVFSKELPQSQEPQPTGQRQIIITYEPFSKF